MRGGGRDHSNFTEPYRGITKFWFDTNKILWPSSRWKIQIRPLVLTMGSSEGPGDKTLKERDRGHFPYETWCKLLWPFYAGLVVLIPWILSVCSIILAVQWRGFPHTGTISQQDCLISMAMDVFMSMRDKFFYWFALPSRNIFFLFQYTVWFYPTLTFHKMKSVFLLI